jgi:hypothetical protein
MKQITKAEAFRRGFRLQTPTERCVDGQSNDKRLLECITTAVDVKLYFAIGSFH